MATRPTGAAGCLPPARTAFYSSPRCFAQSHSGGGNRIAVGGANLEGEQRAGVEAGGRKRVLGWRGSGEVELEGEATAVAVAAMIAIGDGKVGGRVGNCIEQAVRT